MNTKKKQGGCVIDVFGMTNDRPEGMKSESKRWVGFGGA